MYKFKFADIGEGLHEGTVGEIFVKIDTKVNEGDALFSVETAKVTTEITSPVTGKIKKILINTGATIHVGDIIFHIDNGEIEPSKQQDNKIENLDKKIKNDNSSKIGVSVVESIKTSNKLIKDFEKSNNTKNYSRIFTTPYARKLASEKNININDVVGSGINGRILAKDIEEYSKKVVINYAKTSPSLKPFSKPITPIRQAIANAMTNSWKNVAYTNLSIEINMTKLWDERKILAFYSEKKYKIKVSFTALIALATIKILKIFPEMNSKFDEKNNILKHDGKINLGIAVDTPKGLMVPVIKNAHTKNIIEISKEIKELATKAKDDKLNINDMKDGTFTITNYGSVGATFGIPVINYPEIGILGIGQIIDKVFANKQGNFYNGKSMYLSLAADHKWIDGADIGRFIIKIKELLENPILLLGEI